MTKALLERYLDGEHEAVWDEIYELDYAQFGDDIDAVATATMSTVRSNLELIISRLRSESFVFSQGDALRPPDIDADDRMLRIDERLQDVTADGFPGRPLAASVRAFYRVVGAVNLTGVSPHWPAIPDPLDPTYAADHFLNDGLYVASLESLEASVGEMPTGSCVLPFSPDLFHKEDISGGPSYGWDVVSPSADAFCTEIETAFVPYLRFSLSWGGFPGLRLYRNAPMAWVADLTKGLEPF